MDHAPQTTTDAAEPSPVAEAFAAWRAVIEAACDRGATDDAVAAAWTATLPTRRPHANRGTGNDGRQADRKIRRPSLKSVGSVCVRSAADLREPASTLGWVPSSARCCYRDAMESAKPCSAGR
jgi:hypothetical protein